MLMRRPLPFALGATALMLLIAAPALSLKEDTAAIAMFPKDFETRVGFELRRAEARPGRDRADPGARRLRRRATVDQRRRRRATSQTLAGLPDVAGGDAARSPPATAQGADRGDPRARRPESESTVALVDRVRETPGPAGATVSVGGATAQNQDDTGVISGSLWKVGAVRDRR